MRRTAATVGALFWISNLVTLVGSAIAGTVPTSPAALATLPAHAAQVTAGTLIGQINGAAIIGYAVLLFPLLKRQHEGWALGYLAFKVAEALLLAVSAVVLLSMIPLSQNDGGLRVAGAAPVDATASVTLAQQFWAARLAALAYLVATPILNVVLYRSRLVPRFLPVWGFAALAMLAVGLAIGVGDPSRGFEAGQVLVIPIILWELTFATWLIVKGFATERHDARDSRDARDAAAERRVVVGTAT